MLLNAERSGEVEGGMQESVVILIGSLSRKEDGLFRRIFFPVCFHAFCFSVHARLDLDGDDLFPAGNQELYLSCRASPREHGTLTRAKQFV